MTSTDEVTTHLTNVLAELRKAVDASVEIRSRSKADAKAIAMIWESFLGTFIGYIMKKGRETGQNLLADISFRNIWRR
ncbi:MAG: hypothetical protein ACOY35_01490 [Bacillota bacterium]